MAGDSSNDPRLPATANSDAIANTLLSERSGEAHGTSRRVSIQSGNRTDYPNLITVEPDHYVIEREIARGGMGRILAARDRRLGRLVAIKELLHETDDLRARFVRETRITAKLQHPAIVNLLEAGAWPDGEPFYAMKLITGTSLASIIAERPTLVERLALLPNVIAAVDALAYAHNVRVIHRDLKPENVLVGEFGETVVIDWGLAKDLANTTEPDATIDARGSDGARGETVVGDVIGTPAFMPLEQAQGDAVDERADVYALGAILYHVLAGAPPYCGESPAAVLGAVVAGPPTAVDSRVPGIPTDLVTIVGKAMSRAAVDRYATAKELATDLKQFQTGQLVGAHQYSTWQLVRRWARRHRTSLAIVIVSAALLAVLGVISVRRILREQALTEQSRGEAEDLMNFMLVDLSEKLEPRGELELLDVVARKAVAYYDRRTEGITHAQLAKQALARRHLGDVLASQGRTENALAEYRTALSLTEKLVASVPHHDDYRRDTAAAHDRIGDMLAARGDSAGALATYRQSLGIREPLAAKSPANLERQQNLSVSHHKIGGILLAQGNSEGALVEFRASLAIDKAIVDKSPHPEWQRDLAVSHDNIGNILFAQGDGPGALHVFRAGQAITQKLLDKDAKNDRLRRQLAIGHNRIGMVLFAQGSAQDTLNEHRAALRIFESLAAEDPTSSDRLRDLAFGHEQVGTALFAQGDEAAREHFQTSLATLDTLARRDPTNADLLRSLATNHTKVGNVHVRRGALAEALAAYRAAFAIYEPLATKDPTNAMRLRDLSVSHNKIADVLLQQGDRAGALTSYIASLEIFKQLAEREPTNARRQRDLSVVTSDVGNIMLAAGDTHGALSQYRASLAIIAPLAAKDPTNVDLHHDLALGHENIGNALAKQGHKRDAFAEYRTALALARDLAAKDSTNDVGSLVKRLTAKTTKR